MLSSGCSSGIPLSLTLHFSVGALGQVGSLLLETLDGFDANWKSTRGFIVKRRCKG